MSTHSLIHQFMTLASAGALIVALPAAAQVDADAAELLFKQNECTKCHNPTQNKKGPSLKKTAKKYKGDANAEKEIIKHLTTPKKVKLDDGTEADHKLVETKDPKALSNLSKWILAQ